MKSATNLTQKLPPPLSHQKNNKEDKMKKHKGDKGAVHLEGTLVNQCQRKVKLEGEDFNVEDPMKLENDSLTEEFAVTREDPAQDGQRSACSCREEIESLKDAVKQLTLQVNKQNQVITGIKSSLRNAVLSLMTCYQDQEVGEGHHHDGSQEDQDSPIIVIGTTSQDSSPVPVAEDPLLIENDGNFDSAEESTTQDNLQDGCSSILIVKCTGGSDDNNVNIPKSSVISSDETPSSCKAGSHFGQVSENTKMDDEAEMDMDDEEWEGAGVVNEKKVDMDHDKNDDDSSYVPDESEDESDNEKDTEDDYGHQGNKLKMASHSSKGNQKSGTIIKEATGIDCSKCGKKNFKSTKLLRRHIRDFHSNRPLHKCHLCSKVFRTPKYLNHHIQSVHEGVRYKCTYCPGKFISLGHVRRHEKNVHEEGALTQNCEICGIHLLNTKLSLRNHMNIIHKALGSTRPSQERVVRKNREPKLKKPRIPRSICRAIIFQCELCPVSFSEKEELQCHRSQVHGITTGVEANKNDT